MFEIKGPPAISLVLNHTEIAFWNHAQFLNGGNFGPAIAVRENRGAQKRLIFGFHPFTCWFVSSRKGDSFRLISLPETEKMTPAGNILRVLGDSEGVSDLLLQNGHVQDQIEKVQDDIRALVKEGKIHYIVSELLA